MTEINTTENSEKKSLNFIEQIVEKDLQEGKNGGRIQTRFPPEPNGYLHIGHAKAICLDFGIAQRYGGTCNLRFDDTNPTKEDVEYVEAIKEDIQWLGFQWGNEYYASTISSNYGTSLSVLSKKEGYVDEQTSEEIAAQKGTPTQPERKVLIATARLRKAWNCSENECRKKPKKARWCCVPRLIWPTRTCTSATQLSTVW